jgi:hypothetical protein
LQVVPLPRKLPPESAQATVVSTKQLALQHAPIGGIAPELDGHRDAAVDRRGGSGGDQVGDEGFRSDVEDARRFVRFTEPLITALFIFAFDTRCCPRAPTVTVYGVPVSTTISSATMAVLARPAPSWGSAWTLPTNSTFAFSVWVMVIDEKCGRPKRSFSAAAARGQGRGARGRGVHRLLLARGGRGAVGVPRRSDPRGRRESRG